MEDDEEARLRARLLARKGKQTVAGTDGGAVSSVAGGKKSHHHHHKKKKRQRSASDNEEGEAGEIIVENQVKPARGISSVASAVTTFSLSAEPTAMEEDTLNIKPPQVTSDSGKRQHKKRRNEREIVYEKSQSEFRKDDRPYREVQIDDDPQDLRRRLNKTDDWRHGDRGRDVRDFRGVDESRGRQDKRHEHQGYSRVERSEMDVRNQRDDFRGGPPRQQRDYYPAGRKKNSPPASSNRWLSKAAGVIESGSKTGDEKIRADKREEHEKRQGKSDDRKTNKDAYKQSGVSSSKNLTAVSSPEATPTMDELEDQDATVSKKKKSSGRRHSGSTASKGSVEDINSDDEVERAFKKKADSSSSRSSMESGEHRSDEEKRKKDENVPVKRDKYSKFESSPEESGESSDDDSETGKNKRDLDNSDDENFVDDNTENSQKKGLATGQNLQNAENQGEERESLHAISPAPEVDIESSLPIYFPAIMGCRSVEEFHCLNRIEEGTYGVVYRAKEKRTDEVVALKRLKMEKEKEGFPITSLREINMLLKAGKHPNIINVREIVVGSNLDKIYLVMDYVEHDLKSLMESMRQPFLVGEVKTLMKQLLAGVHHLHDNWILHRDLKTSNLLLSHKGILKIGDFGLAREYGSPLNPYTPIVVTLWYRSPELLLGIKEYSTPIDIWSVGCIFAELLTLKPLFTGKSEIEQLNKIFKMLGTPNDTIWPGYSELPGVKRVQFVDIKYNSLRKHFGATLSDKGFHLLNRLLTFDPTRRISAMDALQEDWFAEEPRPVRPELFPTWPAKSEQSKGPKKAASPKPPSGGKQFPKDESDKDLYAKMKSSSASAGFSLKFDAPKF